MSKTSEDAYQTLRKKFEKRLDFYRSVGFVPAARGRRAHVNRRACAGPACARDLSQPARARADRVPCALEESFREGRAHVGRVRSGRAHWEGCSGRAVRADCCDQCAYPLQDEVASAHTPAKTRSAVYTAGPCGSDDGPMVPRPHALAPAACGTGPIPPKTSLMVPPLQAQMAASAFSEP